MKRLTYIFISFFLLPQLPALAQQPAADSWWHNKERTIHYRPEGDDFVCINGKLRFNRALYGTNTAFRVEAGDLPEFALYLPGMGGSFRLGIIAGVKSKWLINAQKIKATYRPGSMLYDISDPLLGSGTLHIAVLALAEGEGIVIRAGWEGPRSKAELFWAFGGATGKKFSRDGDIGADPESSFYLQPGYCKDNVYSIQNNSFHLYFGKDKTAIDTPKQLTGIIPAGSSIKIADATKQNSPLELYRSVASATPAITGRMLLPTDPAYFLIHDTAALSAGDPTLSFANAEKARKELAGRVRLTTPDAYINTLGGALAVAADGIWEAPSYLHGAVAWRMRLNAWRGPYVADPLGWHNRAEQHFSSYALSQVTTPTAGPVVPDTALHLARQLEKIGTSVFSSGYISRNPGGDIRAHHYDMNLVFIDELLEHFNWTGNREYVKKMWPVLQRHLAWEKRNFDADGDGLYDAYAAIWASDALQYSGGGVTHTSAYNYRANKTAAELAAKIGEDPVPYQKEAVKILTAMNSQLWMPSNGWYAEYKDRLGWQQLHPAAALWSIYHAIDSKVPDPFQAWQCLQYINSSIPHIPVKAKGLAENDLYVLSTTNWQPYTWSLNNVALAELQHTALAYWQAGDPEQAFKLWKSSLVESMYLGASPGNFQQLSFYDAIRGELYRDFADPIGATARSLVEGLFGIVPDALNDTLTIQPGLPEAWKYASLHIPDIAIDYKQTGNTDRYTIRPAFSKPLQLKFRVRARFDAIVSVTVNGEKVAWATDPAAMGAPLLALLLPPAGLYDIAITWQGASFEKLQVADHYTPDEALRIRSSSMSLLSIYDPQSVLKDIARTSKEIIGIIQAGPGNKTFFIQVKQGPFYWWQPVSFTVKPAAGITASEQQPKNGLKFAITNNSTASLKGKITVNPGAHSYTVEGDAIAGGNTPEINVPAAYLLPGSNTVQVMTGNTVKTTGNLLNWNITAAAGARFDKVDLTAYFNDKVTQVFRQAYLSPRPSSPTLQLPTQGIGNWCYPLTEANIDDAGLRRLAGAKNEWRLPQGIPLATPGSAEAKNILFTSLWDNYPDSAVVPLQGRASHVYLLMAGTTNAMQTQMDNGSVTITYTDGSSAVLLLKNPGNWWPIEQDYYTDGYAFTTGAPRPLRVSLKKGTLISDDEVYTSIKGFTNRAIDGGAATVLDMSLQTGKELKSLTLKTLSNDVVIGLMSVTLLR